MKDKKSLTTDTKKPVLKEVKIDCGVMDNAGSSSYIKTIKKVKKVGGK